jgi:hypothetical protein
MTQDSRTGLDIYDAKLRRVWYSFMAVYVCKYLLVSLAGWGFCWGIWILILRIIRQEGMVWLLGPVIGVIPIGVLCAVLAWRRTPNASRLKALLDGYSASGGLYMVTDEVDTESWQGHLSQCRSPRIQWQAKRSLVCASLALLFVLVAFLIPARFVEAVSGAGLDIEHVLEDITDQVEILAEEEIVTRIEAYELQEKIQEVRRQARTGEVGKTWESLDHLQEKLNQRAAEAAMSLLQQTETASRTQTLAQAMQLQGANFDEQVMAGSMEALARMLSQKLAEDLSLSHLDEALLKQIKAALESGQFDPADLAALADQMDMSKVQMRQCLARLCEGRLIDPSQLGLCDTVGQCDGEGLGAFLAQAGVCQDFNEVTTCFCSGNSSGSGGISRGRGDAPMWFGDASSEDGVGFKEQVLPRTAMPNLKDAQTVGVSLGDPTLSDSERGPSMSGALAGVKDSGSSAVSQQILPRHKHTVKRYFERQPSPTGKTDEH